MKYPVIKQNRLFLRAYGKGRRCLSDGLCLYVLRGRPGSGTQVGFTVKKSRGNAVERNRIRRRMREAYRALYPLLKEGYTLVIVARQGCERYKSTELCEQLYAMFAKAELLRRMQNAE